MTKACVRKMCQTASDWKGFSWRPESRAGRSSSAMTTPCSRWMHRPRQLVQPARAEETSLHSLHTMQSNSRRNSSEGHGALEAWMELTYWSS